MHPMPTPTLNPWQTTPRKTSIIFLLGVFFIFASFGFDNDVMSMGLEPTLRFAIFILLNGLFAVAYAVFGISLRRHWWKAVVPIFVVQFLCMNWLAHWLPEAPRPVQMGAEAIGRLQGRLVFDGFAIIASVCLGYTGLVYVSVSEGRRHGRAQMEKATLESEMAAAREVQRVMVPEDLPQIAGYSIESVYRPAAEVGGDFFQVIPLKSGRTLVVIGDVSGKGLRAAMIVSMIVGTLRAVSGYTEEPAEIVAELNRRLWRRMHEGFATCLAVRLDEDGKLTLANAGHLPPYLNGAEVQLPGSLPLGLEENAACEQISLRMAPGDAIVLLTDGIAEARNDQHVLLGFTRVESMLRAGATAHSVAETAQQYGQNDDITVLRVARL
jgi:hypothetical protein